MIIFNRVSQRFIFRQPTSKSLGEVKIHIEWPQTLVIQFSHSVMSNSLRPHESQHARSPRPSPTPRVHSDSRPTSQWCHPAISSSVLPFSSCPQSLPASESFPMSQLFAWGGQTTGASALASFLPKKSQGWSPSEWTGWISLQPKGLSRVFSNTTVQKHQFFHAQPSSQSNSHIHTWPQEKLDSLNICNLASTFAGWRLYTCSITHSYDFPTELSYHLPERFSWPKG